MAIKVGIAPGSWGVGVPGEPGQVPWERFLDESVQAGYEWIEAGLIGYLPTDPEVTRAELRKRGTGVVATTVMKGHLETPEDWPTIEAEVLRAGEFGAALGTRHLVLIDDVYVDNGTGRPALPAKLDESSWKRLIDGTHRVADLVKGEFGLPIAFHGHMDTHVETPDQMEAFLEDTDPERVSLCFDTGHYAFGGGDPVSFLRTHHDRVSYMHFKGLDPAIFEKVKSENIPLKTATEMWVFGEMRRGAIDYAGLAKVIHEVGYDGWAMVEQDMGRPLLDLPLPMATRAREYLREIGIG